MKNTLDMFMDKRTLEVAIDNIYENGLPHGLNCGIQNLDELFRLDRGALVTITGVPNMGKSEFIDFLTVQYNKLYGMKTLYFSPENQPISLHLSKLYRKFDGLIPSKQFVNKDRVKAVMNYIYDNFLFFNYQYEYSIDDLLRGTKEQIAKNNISILVIDSYNKLYSQITNNNETEIISRILDKLERFAKANNILILLVAHPRKMERDANGEYKIPKGYDINGSANFSNKSDFVLAVQRHSIFRYSTIQVDKVRFSNYGGKGTTYLGYDPKSGNFYDIPEAIIDEGIDVTIPSAPAHVPFAIPETSASRNGKDLLDITVSGFKSPTDTTPYDVNLWSFLTTDKYKKQLDVIRSGSPEKVKRGKATLPAITPSVIVQEKRDEKHIVKHTGLICIDIDYKDNSEYIDKIFDILKNLPYVAFAQKSASGNGYYAIIPIKDGNKHREHFLALEEDFAAKGIAIDKSCKDQVRLRYYSFDDNRYINPKTEVYTRQKCTKQQIHFSSNTSTKSAPSFVPSNTTQLIQELDDACQRIAGKNVCPTYQAWFEVGCALANELGEQGRKYYHTFSKGYANYNHTETDNKYDECLLNGQRYNFSHRTIFHYLNSIE